MHVYLCVCGEGGIHVYMCVCVLSTHICMQCVTNSYLGSIPVTNELHQVSKGSKSHLISGGDSSCSWVLVRALDPVGNEELQAIMLGEEVEC